LGLEMQNKSAEQTACKQRFFVKAVRTWKSFKPLQFFCNTLKM
jgi:hypothetical protein